MFTFSHKGYSAQILSCVAFVFLFELNTFYQTNDANEQYRFALFVWVRYYSLASFFFTSKNLVTIMAQSWRKSAQSWQSDADDNRGSVW